MPRMSPLPRDMASMCWSKSRWRSRWRNAAPCSRRPRRPEELVTEQGGGVVFSQGAHQVDIVRLLGGGRVHSVRALTGAWDPARPTEGAYAALLTFESGAIASLGYNGYGHFDGDEFCRGIGELGRAKPAGVY